MEAFSVRGGRSRNSRFRGPELAVPDSSKTQRGGQNAILVNIAHILQTQHPRKRNTPVKGFDGAFDKDLSPREGQVRCMGRV